jgi:hypothetical protein
LKRKEKTMERKTIAIIFMAVLAAFSASADEKGGEIIREMDARMNFDECRMEIRIEDYDGGAMKRSLSAKAEYAKGVGTRIEFTAPAKDKGKRVLMSGDSMWMSAPSVSKPVRLSGKESFMGTSFTNDDVMNFDKSDDYESSVVAEDGSGWTVTMTARGPAQPYQRIEARIGRNYLPESMVFYARSGKASKRVAYSGVKAFGSKERPSVMAITDLMEAGKESRVVFEVIEERAVDRARLSPAGFGR